MNDIFVFKGEQNWKCPRNGTVEIYKFQCAKLGETTCVFVCPDFIICAFISEWETRQSMNEEREKGNGQRVTGNEERVREIAKIS